jgi:hypothetical protein
MSHHPHQMMMEYSKKTKPINRNETKKIFYLQFEQVMVFELVLSFVFHLYLNEDVFDFVIFPTNFPFYFHNDNNSKKRKERFFFKVKLNKKLHMVDVVMKNFLLTIMVDQDPY